MKIAKGCSEYIQGDSWKLPSKNLKCPFVKNIARSQKAASQTSQLLSKGQAATVTAVTTITITTIPITTITSITVTVTTVTVTTVTIN